MENDPSDKKKQNQGSNIGREGEQGRQGANQRDLQGGQQQGPQKGQQGSFNKGSTSEETDEE